MSTKDRLRTMVDVPKGELESHSEAEEGGVWGKEEKRKRTRNRDVQGQKWSRCSWFIVLRLPFL